MKPVSTLNEMPTTTKRNTFFPFMARMKNNGLTLQQGRFRSDIMTSKDGKVMEQIIGEQPFQYHVPPKQPT